MNSENRCFGNKPGQTLYADYHDNEWGKPCHDDQHLFEMLILEGAQAGLNWETILKKREGYRKAFHNFEVDKVANMTDQALKKLLEDPSIIRNRLKVFSARKNARVYQQIQQEFGSFATYLWNYVKNKPIKNSPKSFEEVPAKTPLSDEISKDLKRRGMSFVGSTIIYAYMQAVGLVDDHLVDCCCY